MKAAAIAAWGGAASILVLLVGQGCGDSSADIPANNGDGGAGGDGASGGGAVACASNADCEAKLPATTPAGCATGRCDVVQGTCVFSAKDADKDGHPMAGCQATDPAVKISPGDDCDDSDSTFYPGHPKSCATNPDGSTPAGTVCKQGRVECLPDGTASGCLDTLACENQACVAQECKGVCAPGAITCADAKATQTCSEFGQWGEPTSCGAQACKDGKCAGDCGPGSTRCEDGGLETCGDDGTWGSPSACVNSSCTKIDDTSASCQGSCSEGQTNCSGNGLQQCVAGAWGTPIPCGNAACKVATPGSASCVGSCAPDSLKCLGQQPQKCDANGVFQNSGSACVNQACQTVAGATCAGVCQPLKVQACGNCNIGSQTCSAAGAWGNCNGNTGCAPGNVQSCADTCGGQAPAEFQTGKQICTGGCSYPSTCTANAGGTRSTSAVDPSAQHLCGVNQGNGLWGIYGAIITQCGCILKTNGYNFNGYSQTPMKLPAGHYTWTVNVNSMAVADAFNGVELLVRDANGVGPGANLADQSWTSASGAISVGFDVTECQTIAMSIIWNCSSAGHGGFFYYTSDSLHKDN